MSPRCGRSRSRTSCAARFDPRACARSRASPPRFRLAAAEWPSEPVDPFFNVNSPEDLALAEALLREAAGRGALGELTGMEEGKERAPMRVIGLAGWSGAGKTTLIVRLIPELARRGYSVSTLKHAHHGFDVDQPGKDSFEHRAAGAREVLVASSTRLALMRELRGAPEPPLADLLAMLAPVDLVLVEGFKRDALAKIEVWREAGGKAPIHPQDPHVVALVSDGAAPSARLPHAHIDDIAAVADLVLAHAEPIETVLERLARSSGL